MENKPHSVTMELHPLEAEFIWRIRNEYPYGEVIIETRNGLPDRIGQKVVYKKLGQEIFDLKWTKGV